jgi:hypothetical protein
MTVSVMDPPDLIATERVTLVPSRTVRTLRVFLERPLATAGKGRALVRFRARLLGRVAMPHARLFAAWATS